MTVADWPTRIVHLVRVKERIRAVDEKRVFPMTLPAVGASAENIDAFEAHAGLSLAAEHRSFLGAADGWRAFFETQDLLSLGQMAGGEHRDAFAAWIDSAPPQALAHGYSSATLLPIAVDLDFPLFAVMPVREGHVASQVLLLDPSGILETFDDFDAYFDSVIEDTERNLQDFESGAYRF